MNIAQKSASSPSGPDRRSAKPGRLLSVSAMARRAGIGRATVAAGIRRGVIAPDFTTDSGSIYFRASRINSVRARLY